MLGLGYLGDHPLAANISATMAALAPVPPNVSDYAPVPPASWAQPFVVGPAVIAFDGTTGAIVNLTLAGVAWADAAHPLAQYIYQTYNDSDYDAQVRTFLSQNPCVSRCYEKRTVLALAEQCVLLRGWRSSSRRQSAANDDNSDHDRPLARWREWPELCSVAGDAC